MLSACAEPAPSRSPSSAQAISVSIDTREPRIASTATTAAAALAALPPRPLESGSPLLMVNATPRRSPSVVKRASAAIPAVFFAASRGRRPPSPRMSSMRTPGPRQARRHLVAGRVEREAKDVEPARDVRHGRGREGGHRSHAL